jgi:hypothetical protein
VLNNVIVLCAQDVSGFFNPSWRVFHHPQDLRGKQAQLCFWDMQIDPTLFDLNLLNCSWIVFFSRDRFPQVKKVFLLPQFGGFLYNVSFNEENKKIFHLIYSFLQEKKPLLLGSEWEKVFQKRLLHTQEKALLLEELSVFFDSQMRSRLKNNLLSALDEIIMNAIFDAPGSFSHQAFSHRSRADQFALLNNAVVDVSCFVYQKNIFIQVTDYFGNLVMKDIFLKMTSDYQKKEYVVLEEIKNAGLGMMKILSSDMSLHFFCKKKEYTTVSLFLSFDPEKKKNSSLGFALGSI